MAHKKHPVIIIGGGPAGATSALHLLRKGITPVIIERDTHPRYHVGESLTGATALSLKDLGLGPRIDAMNYPINTARSFTDPTARTISGSNSSGATRKTNRFQTSPGM